MHKSGWVHRDLSAGNIIIVGGRGKITDLEYATREGQQGRAGRTVSNHVFFDVCSVHLFIGNRAVSRGRSRVTRLFISAASSRKSRCDRISRRQPGYSGTSVPL